MSESEPFKCRTETRKRHSEQENVFESEQCKSGIYLLSMLLVVVCVFSQDWSEQCCKIELMRGIQIIQIPSENLVTSHTREYLGFTKHNVNQQDY